MVIFFELLKYSSLFKIIAMTTINIAPISKPLKFEKTMPQNVKFEQTGLHGNRKRGRTWHSGDWTPNASLRGRSAASSFPLCSPMLKSRSYRSQMTHWKKETMDQIKYVRNVALLKNVMECFGQQLFHNTPKQKKNQCLSDPAPSNQCLCTRKQNFFIGKRTFRGS